MNLKNALAAEIGKHCKTVILRQDFVQMLDPDILITIRNCILNKFCFDLQL